MNARLQHGLPWDQRVRFADGQYTRASAPGQLAQRREWLRHELSDRYEFDKIMGRAPAIRQALVRVGKLVSTLTTIQLMGESSPGV